MSTEEKRLKSLLAWATAITLVALLILVVDFGIKRSILEAARGQKESPGAAFDAAGPDVDDDAGTPAARVSDEDDRPGPETD